jgi:hypothetical protein
MQNLDFKKVNMKVEGGLWEEEHQEEGTGQGRVVWSEYD